MRTKENDFLSKYYTNNSVKIKIDKALKDITETVMPKLTATDCTEKEEKKYKKEIRGHERIIKEADPEYYQSTYLLDKWYT